MVRTVGTNKTADIKKTVTSPRMLIKIVAGANSLFYSTAEDITFSGDTYTKQDITVKGLELSHGGASKVTIEVRNDAAFLAIALGDSILDAVVTIYETANITRSTDDVPELYEGTVDHPVIVPGRVSLICSPPETRSPSKFIDAASGFTTLDGPGTYRVNTGVVILRRDDG